MQECRHGVSGEVARYNIYISYKMEDFNKTIWLLWFQGWDDAPWIVQQAKQSWEIHNPEWNIVLLDANNIKEYLEDADYIMDPKKGVHFATRADIIRLALLYKYGGVWADANVFCMKPLEYWIYSCIMPVGVWMYHGYSLRVGVMNGCAVWFIASIKGNELIRKWKEAVDLYWLSQESGHEYHLLESIFIKLRTNDNIFADLWDRVPFVDSELFGESHSLAAPHGMRFLMIDDAGDFKEIIQNNPPFMIKLWNNFDTIFPDKESEICKKSNGYFAIMLSRRKID